MIQAAPAASVPDLTNPNSSWLNLTPSAFPSGYISQRSGASMIYDPVDREVLLFGGASVPDTWAWRQGTWTEPIDPATCTGASCPSPRSYAGFAGNSADQVVILFGGLGGSGPLGDTWAFSGGVWTTLSASVGTAPAPRWEASMTFDSGDNDVILSGRATASGARWGTPGASAGEGDQPDQLPLDGAGPPVAGRDCELPSRLRSPFREPRRDLPRAEHLPRIGRPLA